MKRYKTLEEYRDRLPNFVIIEMIQNGAIASYGSKYPVQKGQEILMIAGEAKKAVESGAGIISRRTMKGQYRRYNGENLNGRRLMIWRAGGIGDLMWVRPILCHLKDKYPESTILFATREMFHCMVATWGDCLDGLSVVPLNMSDTMDAADYHLSFDGLVESCDEAETTDIHDLFARHAGCDPDEVNWCRPMRLPNWEPDKEHDKNPCIQYMVNKRKYAVVQYRASSPMRTPYLGSIVAACNAVTDSGYRAVLCDLPSSAREIDNIISCCKTPAMVYNFSERARDILDTIRLINHSRLVVGPDSSLVHIAAMQGIPSVGIYGPFPGMTRQARNPLAKWIEPPESKVCKSKGRHCFKNRTECDGDYKCWGNLNNARLQEIIAEVLNG